MTTNTIKPDGTLPAGPPQIEDWSDKRLVQNSSPYHSRFDALDACAGVRALDGCDYAYVDEDNRVVSIHRYFDVAPDKPVNRGQRRVIIPKARRSSPEELAAAAQLTSIGWTASDDLNKVARLIQQMHPGSTFTARTDADPGKCKHLHITITIPE